MKNMTFQYSLVNPVEYTVRGELKKVECIIITAPTVKQTSYVSKIKQAISQSNNDLTKFVKDMNPQLVQDIFSGKNPNEDKNGKQEKPDFSITSLSTSSVDMDSLMKTFYNLLGDCAIIDDPDKTKLSSVIIDKFLFEDAEKMLEGYINNFLI